ncbi:UDP binding domain-containing protein, partial [Sphingobacterium siyangense]
VGFGGSCFKKDILNLVYIARSYNLFKVADYWEQVVTINDHQRQRFAERIIKTMYNTVNGKKIVFLGWAFKKDTNDTREASAIYVADHLLEEQANIVVYDPKVKEDQIYNDIDGLNSRSPEQNRDLLKISNDPYSAIQDAYAIAIMTEWDEFKVYDWELIKTLMKRPAFVFDGRRILDSEKMDKMGFEYYTIGE